jgi:EAL domain-containing protein (putative c-di-GMP-specific phosphodiesterase class I)
MRRRIASIRRCSDPDQTFRSFVSNLTLNKNAAAILHAIATLGRNLSIETTAEGVETEAQLEAVVALGCTEMQGNLFSHARPAAELVQFFPKANSFVGNAA